MRTRSAVLVLLAALAVAGGCSKRRSAVILRQPAWDYQAYRRLAVVPFKPGRPEAAEAARQAEFQLVDHLVAGGVFAVSSRSDLADVLTEQELSRLADVADPGTAMPQGLVQVAQALVVGRLTEFDLRREQHERRRPRFARDRKGRLIRDRGGRPIVVGEDVCVEFRHVARVGGNVRVLDAATGRVLLSVTVPPIEYEARQVGAPPRAEPEELALRAAQELGTAFYRQIAPQAVEVKLDRDSLIVAAEYYEGDYEPLKKVPVTLDEVLVVVRDLPRACDRNDFRLAISPKEGRGYVVDQAFTWSPSLGRKGAVLHVPMSVLTATGEDEFTVKLFALSDDRPLLKRDFKLVEPEGD